MWFKNLQIYRLPAWAYTPEQLEEALASQSFSPASSNELLRQGWDKPRPNGGLVHVVNKQMLIVLGTEKNCCRTASSTRSPRRAPPRWKKPGLRRARRR
jgi:DNA recombination-dependent growth factor C